ESARMYSFLVLVMGIAPITAPLIGGQLLVMFGWRAIFFALAAFGLFCFVMVWFWLD
ncbi:MAG: Bcr/CflA family drug resistance efflux transporter, partial [Caldilineaceae bacterium]|nr:Bcr/CflA family drug resistance efflux transporter [Caldilineaceae bacterium]